MEYDFQTKPLYITISTRSDRAGGLHEALAAAVDVLQANNPGLRLENAVTTQNGPDLVRVEAWLRPLKEEHLAAASRDKAGRGAGFSSHAAPLPTNPDARERMIRAKFEEGCG